MTRRGLPLYERFWPKVDKSGECWIWTGALANNAYGEIKAHGKKLRAHRVSYEFAYGPIPQGLVVDHKCHVPKCVRPEHLQAVTNKQNVENFSGPYPSSKSGIRGVSWSKKSDKWVVYVRHNGHNYNVGYFKDIEEAKAAAIAKRNELHTNNLEDRAAA